MRRKTSFFYRGPVSVEIDIHKDSSSQLRKPANSYKSPCAFKLSKFEIFLILRVKLRESYRFFDKKLPLK